MADMISNTNVFNYLGVSSPTDAQKAVMSVVRKGIEGSARNFCNWPINEDSYVAVLPRVGVIHANNVWSAQRINMDVVTNRSRMQLPVPFVSAVDSVYENFGAKGGEGSSDFTSDYLLTAGQDYFLDAEGTGGAGKSFSMSGGLIRVNRTWSSVPMTIKVSFTAGFDSSDFDDGIALGLKNWLIQKCADLFMAQTRKNSMMFSSGSGGLVSREKLGDYDVSYRDVFSADGDDSGRGLTDADQDFLYDSGFVFCAVGC